VEPISTDGCWGGFEIVRDEADGRLIPGTPKYLYDLSGNLLSLIYPDGTDLRMAHDAYHRPPSLCFGNDLLTAGYLSDDSLDSVSYFNDIQTSCVYNTRGWPTRIWSRDSSTTYMDLVYGYDASEQSTSLGGQTHDYDGPGRLTKNTGTPWGNLYQSYDAVGNRLVRQEGDTQVTYYTRRPNANGGTIQWSKYGCTYNYQCVDESSSDGDTTRVYTSAVGKTDLYKLKDLPDIGGREIEYVQVRAVARHTDTGGGGACTGCPEPTGSGRDVSGGGATIQSGSSYSIYLRVNGYRSGAKSLSASYKTYYATWYTNPATGDPWTADYVNSLQAGIESADLISSDYQIRVTQVYVVVKVKDMVTYTYDSNGMNLLTSLDENGAVTSFSYDANGNLIKRSDGSTTWTYQWNYDNLLTRVKKDGGQVQAYRYDDLGRRVKTEGKSSSTWTISIFSGRDIIYEVDDAGKATKYIRANGMLLAKVLPSGAIHYYIGDHLGSTRQVRDASRSLVFSAEYEPFGEAFSITGSEAFRFTGEKHDEPTGLMYLRAKQYDPRPQRRI
jgi:YD repeat-containing protein